jgi:hypothetical protein
MSDVHATVNTNDAAAAAAANAAAGTAPAGNGADVTANPAGAAPQNNQAAPVSNGADKTVASGVEQKEAPAYWPKDWREKIAEHTSAGDRAVYERELARLQRMDSPYSVYGSFRNIENTWATKNFIKLPGKEPKPEDVADFHKAIGVPEKPEDYFKDIKLENGAVIGEADRPIADAFAAAVHKVGAPPAVVNAAMNWYFQNQEKAAADLDERDDAFKRESNVTLKDEFGPAFKRKTNAIGALFAKAPGGSDVKNDKALIARLMGGRTADGRLIGDDPDFVRFMVSLADEINPAASIVEDASAGGKGLDGEIADIEKYMKTNRIEYFKDEKKQARYRQLLETRTKIQARA